MSCCFLLRFLSIACLETHLHFLFCLNERYLGYRKDNIEDEIPARQETFMSLLCFVQCILLGSFAAILGAHRSEIIDKPDIDPNVSAEGSEGYDPPQQ